MSLPDVHLHPGCGEFPRNPYDRARLCGVDLSGLEPARGFKFKPTDLALNVVEEAVNDGCEQI